MSLSQGDYSLEVLISEEELKKHTARIAAQISRDYKGREVLFVGILKGAFVFMADLVRRVELPGCRLGFMMVSSYGSGTVSSGNITIKKDLEMDVEGKHVIIVEDIVDTGFTLNYLKKYIANRNAASVKICTMLDKPDRRQVQLEPDYVGVKIPDAFVVGYGLDYDEAFRELPDVCVLKLEK
ncbi:MAG: hypoxanthine phosphoribosyltransferase [Oscillospiraceae bacterium]|nr:hypoxanthine phosphoribosyltransferase [Oscillospiraceae bacterium]